MTPGITQFVGLKDVSARTATWNVRVSFERFVTFTRRVKSLQPANSPGTFRTRSWTEYLSARSTSPPPFSYISTGRSLPKPADAMPATASAKNNVVRMVCCSFP